MAFGTVPVPRRGDTTITKIYTSPVVVKEPKHCTSAPASAYALFASSRGVTRLSFTMAVAIPVIMWVLWEWDWKALLFGVGMWFFLYFVLGIR